MSSLGRGNQCATCCPRCPHPVEDTNHVLCFPAASEWQKSTMLIHQKTCRNVNTNVDPVLEVLLQDFEVNEFPPKWHDLLLCQCRIGWGQVFRGRVSLEWRQYKNLGSSSSRKFFDCETSNR